MARQPQIDRFNKFVSAGRRGCIEWLGSKTPLGYGHFHVDGRAVYAHRWSYEYHVGPIPDGLVIDHLCRNTSCVNPDHLEPVTHAENVKRGTSIDHLVAKARSKTECPQGHPYDDENTYVHPKAGFRGCKTCRRDATRRWRMRNQKKAA